MGGQRIVKGGDGKRSGSVNGTGRTKGAVEADRSEMARNRDRRADLARKMRNKTKGAGE